MKEHTVKYSEIYAETDKAIVYGDGASAIAYLKRRSKPAWHYGLKTRDKALAYAQEWATQVTKNIVDHEARKNTEREARKAFDARLHADLVGKIFHDSWGWEETHNDFVRLVSIDTKKQGRVEWMTRHHLEATGPMSSKVIAGNPTGEIVQCTITGPNSIRVARQSFHLWDGTPEHESWYA